MRKMVRRQELLLAIEGGDVLRKGYRDLPILLR